MCSKEISPKSFVLVAKLPQDSMQKSPQKRFSRFAWGVTLYNLAVVAWGAWVRVTGSGAGCGEHWPDCNGEIVPRDPSAETLVEFTHRATSGLALIAVVALVIWAWRAFEKGHRVRKASAFALIFILAEALLGAGLVIFGLVGDNASPARAVVMSIHLVNTFLLLAGMALAAIWSTHEDSLDLKSPRIRWLWISCALIFAVGITGAIAALGDTLFPSKSLAEGLAADMNPTSHFLLRLRGLHPIVAVTCAIVLYLQAMRWPSKEGKRLQWLVIIQIVAGLVNLALLAPGWMQIIHLILSDLVWISFLSFGLRSLEQKTQGPEPAPA